MLDQGQRSTTLSLAQLNLLFLFTLFLSGISLYVYFATALVCVFFSVSQFFVAFYHKNKWSGSREIDWLSMSSSASFFMTFFLLSAHIFSAVANLQIASWIVTSCILVNISVFFLIWFTTDGFRKALRKASEVVFKQKTPIQAEPKENIPAVVVNAS
jgi:hypothetical protein